MTSKGEKAKKIIGVILFVTLVISLVFVVVSMIHAPSVAPADDPNAVVKGDYLLRLTQCALALVVMFLPSVIEKKFSISIPNYMYVMFFVFLYCAVYLGEFRNFYFIFPHWDLMLHTFSGAMLGALGFSLVSILNDSKRVPIELSPFFVALFALCFAVACGVVWEIYEFTLDGLMGLNMQKYALESGAQLLGREAVVDTMGDLIVDTLGALAVCVAGYIAMKVKAKRVSKEENAEKTSENLCKKAE